MIELNYHISELYQRKVELLELINRMVISYYGCKYSDFKPHYQRRIEVLLTLLNKLECWYLYMEMKILLQKVW
jgi:hypothetical protein